MIALIYAERLLQRQPNMSICRSNVERLMLVSVMVASKILDDMYCRNVYYACAGGLENKELNALEVQFCFLMDFDLNVNPAEFATYCSTLSRSKSYKCCTLAHNVASEPEKVTKPKFWGPSSPPAQPAQVVWGISVPPATMVPKPQHVAPVVGGMITMPFPAIPAQAYHTQATHIIPQSTVHGQTIMGKPIFAPPLYQPQPQLQPQPQVEQGHEAMSFSSATWSPAWSLSSTSRPESPWSQGSGDEASQQPWSTGARPDWPQPADPLGAASAWFNTPAAPCGWPAASVQPTPIQLF